VTEIIGYQIEPETFRKLREIEKRLYDDRPLTPDQRRDLANMMNAVLHTVESFAIRSEP
jgi:hypothetical protein